MKRTRDRKSEIDGLSAGVKLGEGESVVVLYGSVNVGGESELLQGNAKNGNVKN